MSGYPRHQRILFISSISSQSFSQLTPQDSRLSLDFTNTDFRKTVSPCGDVICTNSTPVDLFITRSIKLNNDRSLSDFTRIPLNPKLLVNAVRNELAESDAPFLSTTVVPKHPVELFRHLTHKIGNTPSLSRPLHVPSIRVRRKILHWVQEVDLAPSEP